MFVLSLREAQDGRAVRSIQLLSAGALPASYIQILAVLALPDVKL
jgi:hypothetical protein